MKSAIKSLLKDLCALFSTPWHNNSKSALEAGVHSLEKNGSRHQLLNTGLFAQLMVFWAILSIGLAINSSAVFAQAITPTTDTSTLQSTLSGSAIGTTVSNLTITSNVGGLGNGVGTFTNAGGLTGNGIVLRTGILNSRTPPNSGAYCSLAICDLTSIEFDVKPIYNTLGLNYSFFSWEYPEYVGTVYNDKINIIVTGPGLPGAGVDLATLPNTTIPITINTINNGSAGVYGSAANATLTNSAFFFKAGCSLVTCTSATGYDAVNVVGSEFTMDGGTVPLKNFTPQVQAGQTYHVKVTVNDASDNLKDSQAYFNTIFSSPPDTTISKSVSPLGPVTPGTQLTYSITLSNKGFSSDSVNVSDTIPSNSTYVTGSASNGGTFSGSTILWSNLIVPAGTCADVACSSITPGTLTLTFKVQAGSILAPIQNNVSFSSNLPYTPSSIVSNTVATPVGYSDLTITKTHTGNFTQGQTGATYTLTATNSGAGATNGTVTVVDTLPTGLTATAISGTGWTCTLSTLTCTRSDALAVGASYPTITLTVNVASNAASSVTNNATVSGGGETNTTNNSATDPTTVNVSDLTITKTHTGNFTQGQTGATYTLTATNSGTAATSGTVTIVDTLPTGLTATAISGSGWTCTLATLTCTRSDALAAGSSYPAITLTVNVASNAASSITNSATVSGGGQSNTTNDTATDPTTVNGVSDLTITKSHTGNFTQGQTGATYTLTATNSGTAATSGTVTVVDTLPTGLTATAISGTGWTCTLGTLTCTRSDALAVGASYPAITLTVNVASNAAASITNSATVSGGGETNTANDTATDPTTVNKVSDLTITKTHTGNFTQGQTGATYTLTATNSGTAATSGTVTVVDTLPTGLTATAISGSGWTCTLATLTCTRNNGLAAGASYPTITLTVNVASNAAASITNSATVSGGGQTNTANDTATDPTTVNGVSDLTITKTHTGNFTQGQTGATYTLTATNSGTAATSGTVTIVDTLPTGLTATAISGSGWTCTLGTLTCTRSDALAAGSSYPAITLTVNVASNAASSITNSATVSGGGQSNTANDTATDLTTVNGVSDLTITKTHTGNFTQGQTGAIYTLTATNSGTAGTSGTVTVVDTLPTGLTATAISGSGWT
ncbi:MAG: choice-of-anchor L domain-containing protein, partial [Gloeobacterales cyanobacterium]